MVQRIPYADPKKVASLPGEAKSLLSFAKNSMPKNAYKEMENHFIEVMSGTDKKKKTGKRPKPISSEKSSYGGKLDYVGTGIINDIGIYNPDDIPMDIYEKMSKDPTIALALNVVKNTLASMNWRIDCDDEVQQKVITKIIKGVYRPTVLGLSDAVRLGSAIGEKVWEFTPLKITIKAEGSQAKRIVYNDSVWKYDKIKFIHPGSVKIKRDKYGNFNGIVQSNVKLGKEVSVKPNKLVIYSHNVDFGNWFGEARLKYVYPAWYWSMVLTQFALKYYERRGQPLTVMKAPPGTSTDVNGRKVDNMAHALQIGQAAVSNSVVVLPKELDKNHNVDKWELEIIKDDQRGDMFIQILNYMDSRKLRGLFIPDKMGLAADGSPHSSSGASAGDTLDVFIMTEQALASDIENIFDTQIIPDIQRFNFNKEDIVEASMKIEKLDYTRKLLMKDVLLRMVMTAAGTLRDGRKAKFLPDMRKIAEMLDLPMDTFENMFDEYEMPMGAMSGNNDEDSVDTPVKKKQAQDKNNQNRGTSRKERSTKERSVKEKKS